MAQEAIYAVLRQTDGRGKPTTLTEHVLKRLDYPSTEAMLKGMIAGQLDRSLSFSLCPLVFEAANTGDDVAAEIIVKQGQALAEYATAAIRRYGMQDLEFDVVLCGSLFKGQGFLFIDTITQAVHRAAPHAHIVQALLEPAIGGVLLAYDALEIDVSAEMYDNLACTMPGAEFFSTLDGSETDATGQRVPG